MPEDLGKLEKAKYMFLLAVYSVAYFVKAIVMGLWGWVRRK